MRILKFSVLTLLAVAQLVLTHPENPCQHCPKPCAQAALDGMSVQDLEETLKTAKDAGDFDTHAEAYHRLKVEMATEDGGKTVVIKLKELGLPILATTVIVGIFSAVCTHYLGPKK